MLRALFDVLDSPVLEDLPKAFFTVVATLAHHILLVARCRQESKLFVATFILAALIPAFLSISKAIYRRATNHATASVVIGFSALLALGSTIFIFDAAGAKRKCVRVQDYGNMSIQDALERLEDTLDSLSVFPALPRMEWFQEGTSAEGDRDGLRGRGRRIQFIRAINLSGESKLPANRGDGRNITFVGQPLPLGTLQEKEEARVHLARIRIWGFNAVRFIVTWEAIEHRGPGDYDHAYLEYVRDIIRMCQEFSLAVIVDFHQDVWSRFTGGDGAPRWTLESVGFDVDNMFDSGAAVNGPDHPDISMLWFTNYGRLGAATMFTLFFAGNTFAPSCNVSGIPIQEYLQSHYFEAAKVLATYLRDEPNVIGYDTLNEPSTGYVGMNDLRKSSFPAPLGWQMSAFHSMLVPSGLIAKRFPVYSAPFVLDRVAFANRSSASAWKDPSFDVWRNEGIWDVDPETNRPVLLRPHHFRQDSTGRLTNFMDHFMAPFFEAFRLAIHSVHPSATIFAEPHVDPASPVHEAAPLPALSQEGKYAYAPHYYDVATLTMKAFYPSLFIDYQTELPVFGSKAATRAVQRNLAHVKGTGGPLETSDLGDASSNQHRIPVIVGEIGIPMDINDAYRSGDFSHHVKALDRSIQGLESNLLAYALWQYAPNNDNAGGDHWNGEDLSLYSKSQRLESGKDSDIYDGGRALAAAVRPYAVKTCGIPKSMKFDPFERKFRFVFESVPEGSSNAKCWCSDATQFPTVIYVPHYQYPFGVSCSVSNGQYRHDAKRQTILYQHDPAFSTHVVTIRMKHQH